MATKKTKPPILPRNYQDPTGADALERRAMWFDASASVSQYDKDLAMICREKSKYWLEYENYDHMKIIDLGI